MRYQKLNRNMLEIIVEKNIESQHVNLNGEQVASVCEIIGVQVGRDTEGYQTHYRGQYITLSVWLKQGVSLERFLGEERREYTTDLIFWTKSDWGTPYL